jgi:hypothetical protein
VLIAEALHPTERLAMKKSPLAFYSQPFHGAMLEPALVSMAALIRFLLFTRRLWIA